jgi:sortase B
MFITHKGKVMKNKRNQKNIIWKILLIVFSIVLIICLIIIGIQKYQQKKQQEYYEALLENAGSQPQATEEVPEPETEEAPDVLKSLGIEIPEKDIDFAALKEENSDVYAWIYVPGTNVDYPVLQHPTDDAYYLEHNMDGSKGLPGCIYSESVNTKDFTDPNTVLRSQHEKRKHVCFFA